ncbi:nicotinamide riboside transporter PnuC [Scandinavium goeteborgense]|uniref:Nicotinamide riboside transporter PnuC n=1 Tax=Scandinavium goeteborgense TaxID=1851514 RepID=A0A4R6E3X4_SCAGO|nr:nicotinamide riboside transporter PnuC [Scandinavium goeteborgense]TDN52546.1 nicotinamide mononucleotide transporter [Scandinavium goeteborgense]
MSLSEIAACLAYAISVWLAARNNAHTWWTGIIGSVLYGWVFWSVQLYADVTLQLFFITTSITGWWHWLKGNQGEVLPIRRTRPGHFLLLLTSAVVVAGGYGLLLHTFTNAWAPWLDSLILTFSVLAQFMLMGRRIENWYIWLAVNTLAVPLYAARGLNLTACLYLVFWFNAWHGLYHWRKELREI